MKLFRLTNLLRPTLRSLHPGGEKTLLLTDTDAEKKGSTEKKLHS
jgi:hypothetical protein